MKRIICRLLTVILCLFSVEFYRSKAVTFHEHEWSTPTIEVEPTFEKNGSQIYQCLHCHQTKTETISCWEVGTIGSTTGKPAVNSSRLHLVDYLKLSDVGTVCVGDDFQFTYFAYDENYQYLGNGTNPLRGYWLGEVWMYHPKRLLSYILMLFILKLL